MMNKDGHSDDFTLKKRRLRVPKYPPGRVKTREPKGDLNAFQIVGLTDIQKEKISEDWNKLQMK